MTNSKNVSGLNRNDKYCIIFDLDGTLLYTLDSLQISVNRAFEKMGIGKAITIEQCREFIGNGVQVLVEKSLLAVLGETQEIFKTQVLECFRQEFAIYGSYNVVPYDGVVTLLLELKKKGYLLGVLTNKPQRQAVEVVEKIFGSSIFDYIQGQVEGLPQKPNPKSIRGVIERMGCTITNSVLIGDSEVDVRTGKNAGIYVMGVAWGYRDVSILQEEGADVIVHDADELLRVIENKRENKSMLDYVIKK